MLEQVMGHMHLQKCLRVDPNNENDSSGGPEEEQNPLILFSDIMMTIIIAKPLFVTF